MATHKSAAAQLRSAEARALSGGARLRAALLGSPGLAYLRALISADLIKRGFDVDLFWAPHDRYAQFMTREISDLRRFHPDVVLITVDASSVAISPQLRNSRKRRTRQKVGAALLQRTVLPTLHGLTETKVQRIAGKDDSMLKAIENEVSAPAGQNGLDITLRSGFTSSEVIVGCHAPSLWRRRRVNPMRGSRGACWADGIGTMLSGVTYSCLVVDMCNHPWMSQMRGDVDAFLPKWRDHCTTGKADRGGANDGWPDSFVFIDFPPYHCNESGRQIRA